MKHCHPFRDWLCQERRSPHGERGLKPCPPFPHTWTHKSLPSRGAWIETLTLWTVPSIARRSPHGERGLKHVFKHSSRPNSGSLPSRGAWIETYPIAAVRLVAGGRSPHGERGLKPILMAAISTARICRSPHGERGLKHIYHRRGKPIIVSLPSRGAWIETAGLLPNAQQATCRSPHGERGLKLARVKFSGALFVVAPLTGSVD